MSKKNKISISGDSGSIGSNPFEQLSPKGLKNHIPVPAVSPPVPSNQKGDKKRGRVDICREKSGRGGKVVTVVSGAGFIHTNPQELNALLKQLKNRFGCGGALKGKTIEIQGDQREAIAEELKGRGYRPVFSGG